MQVYGPKMLRYKGVLNMKGSDRKVIFQGVHQLMGSDLGPKWAPGEKKTSKMVFIGIDLPATSCCRGTGAVPGVTNPRRIARHAPEMMCYNPPPA